jgi:hypothetical protein
MTAARLEPGDMSMENVILEWIYIMHECDDAIDFQTIRPLPARVFH